MPQMGAKMQPRHQARTNHRGDSQTDEISPLEVIQSGNFPNALPRASREWVHVEVQS